MAGLDSNIYSRSEIEPTQLGPYRLREVLGHGGMGVVYRGLAEDGREVAVKVISPAHSAEPVFRERFLREAEAACRVSDPHVVACLGTGEGEGRLYLAMELVTGGNAGDLCNGALDPIRAAVLCRDGAAGLAAIHRAGLVHRDVKPDNLFIDKHGHAKLGDFGLVHFADNKVHKRLTATSATLGTPAFMPPEQAQGDPTIDIRADIYALGATLYCLITGCPPFVGSSAWMVVSQSLSKPLPDPRIIRDDCPASIAAIIRRAGALARDERYENPTAMGEDLTAVIEGREPKNAGPILQTITVDPTSELSKLRPAVGSARRILIVDDDSMVRRIHAAAFRQAGYAIEEIADGVGALTRIEDDPPDIVLLDLVLPGIDGAEVIRAVRSGRRKKIPIAVLTNAYFEDELRAARSAGADIIISKAARSPRQVVEDVSDLLAKRVAKESTFAPVTPGMTTAVTPTAFASIVEDARAVLDRIDGKAELAHLLIDLGDVLRPLPPLAAAANAGYIAALSAATEAFVRYLHEWPQHFGEASVLTIGQAITRLGVESKRTIPLPAPSGLPALIVDDDRVSRRAVAQAARKANFDIVEASGGDAALPLSESKKWALIITDLMMDSINGLQFAERARQGGGRDAAIIVLTGLHGFQHVFTASPTGPDAALIKPFLPLELTVLALSLLRADAFQALPQ